VVAEVRERLSVTKQEIQKFGRGDLFLRDQSKWKIKDSILLQSRNGLSVLENCIHSRAINRGLGKKLY
jgi:hypothetical protein